MSKENKKSPWLEEIEGWLYSTHDTGARDVFDIDIIESTGDDHQRDAYSVVNIVNGDFLVIEVNREGFMETEYDKKWHDIGNAEDFWRMFYLVNWDKPGEEESFNLSDN